MIFHDFFDEMKKYFLNFFSVEKKNEKFSTSSKTFFSAIVGLKLLNKVNITINIPNYIIHMNNGKVSL